MIDHFWKCFLSSQSRSNEKLGPSRITFWRYAIPPSTEKKVYPFLAGWRPYGEKELRIVHQALMPWPCGQLAVRVSTPLILMFSSCLPFDQGLSRQAGKRAILPRGEISPSVLGYGFKDGQLRRQIFKRNWPFTIVEQHSEVVANFLDEVACGWGTCFCGRDVAVQGRPQIHGLVRLTLAICFFPDSENGRPWRVFHRLRAIHCCDISQVLNKFKFVPC